MENLPWPLNSRKAITALIVIVVVLVLLATGQIDGETAVTAIVAQAVILIGSIAYEDAAQKQGVQAAIFTPKFTTDGNTTTEVHVNTTAAREGGGPV